MGDCVGLGALAAVGCVAAISVLASVPARATIESVSVTERSCDGGLLTSCKDTGYLNTSLVGAGSQFIGAPIIAGSTTPATFTSAFDAWDAANGDKWTLVNGGTLNLTLDAYVGVDVGAYTAGLSPVIFTLPGETSSSSVTATAPSGAKSSVPISRLVWTQALDINYTPLQGPLAEAIQTLDTFSLSQNAAGANPNFPDSCVPASSGASPAGGAFCGPIYPFQYGSTLSGYELDGVPLGVDPFYDAPQGEWPNASFEAVTLLSTVSTATDTLTVYEGWSYGFALSALANTVVAERLRASVDIPEPSTWAMILLGFVSLAAASRRRPTGILGGARSTASTSLST